MQQGDWRGDSAVRVLAALVEKTRVVSSTYVGWLSWPGSPVPNYPSPSSGFFSNGMNMCACPHRDRHIHINQNGNKVLKNEVKGNTNKTSL